MVNGKCSHCGSTEIYVSEDPFYEGFPIIKTGSGGDFDVHCYLCLECRAIELHAAERSRSLFGKGNVLADVIPKSSTWKKVA